MNVDMKIAELFPIKKVAHRGSDRSVVFLSAEISVVDYLRAFLPDPQWITPHEVEYSPYAYSLKVDHDTMTLLGVDCVTPKPIRRSEVPGIVPDGYLPRVEIYYVRHGCLVLSTSYWMPEQMPQ